MALIFQGDKLISGNISGTPIIAPLGTIIAYMGTTAPKGYLACDGSIHNIVDYYELANFFKTQLGSSNYFGGDGTATFAVPDLRGEFLRGSGTNSHTSESGVAQGSGANVGVHQDATEAPIIKATEHTTLTVPYATNAGEENETDTAHPAAYAILRDSTKVTQGCKYASLSSSPSSTALTGFYTSRPTNTSVLYCIKAVNNDPVVFKYESSSPRWMRFDPTNRKGIVIKKGTTVGTKTWKTDTQYDFTSDIGSGNNGKDFYVYLLPDGTVHAYTIESDMNGTYIGRFHTLCADAGSELTMIAPSYGLSAGDKYLVKPYDKDLDPDFYAFYNKDVISVEDGSKYQVSTIVHPLRGYEAGDILPESIFCLSFNPNCSVKDAMVYDKATDTVVDVYLSSGEIQNVKSKYNVNFNTNLTYYKAYYGLRTAGKRLPEYEMFMSFALGSNEKTNINGSSMPSETGGHVDTNNRRMISAIGVEDACGVVWQMCRDSYGGTATGSWNITDSQHSFGTMYGGHAYMYSAGGAYGDGEHCGSSAINTDRHITSEETYIGYRGVASIKTN